MEPQFVKEAAAQTLPPAKTTQLPSNRTLSRIPPNKDHKPLKRGTFGGLRKLAPTLAPDAWGHGHLTS